MPSPPTDEFKKIADAVHSTGQAHKTTVRKLLDMFHQERRSHQLVRWIKRSLVKQGLECIPPFEVVHLDSQIELRKLAKVSEKAQENPLAVEAIDPVPRVALLEAANRKPITVKRDATVEHAITLMMLHDFSQLPVMQDNRRVDGMISYKSIVSAQSLDAGRQTVRQCMMKNVHVVPSDQPLFQAIKFVMQEEVVLVRGIDDTIVGLVTISDIGEQFVAVAEPFWILEQIENHIRVLLDEKFSAAQIKAAVNDADAQREVQAVSELSFGDYIRLLENPDHWGLLGLSIDRAAFVKQLDKVREIRNNVMHFHPDGISPQHLDALREMQKFFYLVSQFRPNGKKKQVA